MSNNTDMTYVTDVRCVLQHVMSTRKWVVVLCPNSETASDFMRVLIPMLPLGTLCGGRTFRIPKAGCLSVVTLTGPFFTLSTETPFDLRLVGWKDKTNGDFRGSEWFAKAKALIA